MSKQKSEELHPLRSVVPRIGVSHRVLRAWEDRHGAIATVRDPVLERLYTEDDIVRLQILRRLLVLGCDIETLANLTSDELVQLLGERVDAVEPDAARPILVAPLHFTEALDAIAALDELRLRTALTRGFVALSRDEFVDAVLLPLLWQTGELWVAGEIGPAHEHMLSAQIGRLLRWLLDAIAVLPEAPHAIAVTPAGERHEFGALLASVIAAEEGWRVTYLGPDLPASAIAAALETRRPEVLIMSTVLEEAAETLAAELSEIRAATAHDFRMLVGGPGSAPVREEVEELGGAWHSDLAALRRTLRKARPAEVGS